MSTPIEPPLLRFADNTPVRTPADWSLRRREVAEAILPLQYGGLPPTPLRLEAELLSEHSVARMDKARHSTWRLIPSTDPFFSFHLDLWLPAAEGRHPVIIDGDGCWAYVSDEVKTEVLRRGCGLAIFNRCEIAADRLDAREIGLYRLYPGASFGALAAWAWGYHRVVDFLLTHPAVDAGRIAVTGHSRGGKAALLAGATDERIAITNTNNSGCGGAGCYRQAGERSEGLVHILDKFPFWFGPDLPQYINREQELPFDQHFLKALVAPRDLLCTEALADLWANPTGTYATQQAAREVYQLLGASDRIAIIFREGGHAHRYEDWITLLDYMEHRFRGKTPAGRSFDEASINQPPALATA